MSSISLVREVGPKTIITITHTLKVSVRKKIDTKTVIEEFQETKRWTADLDSMIEGGIHVA
jgi:hypothetical protein